MGLALGFCGGVAAIAAVWAEVACAVPAAFVSVTTTRTVVPTSPWPSVYVDAVAPWMLWQLASTGSVIPATIAAKRYYFAESNMPAQVKWIWVVGSLVALVRACGPLDSPGP